MAVIVNDLEMVVDAPQTSAQTAAPPVDGEAAPPAVPSATDVRAVVEHLEARAERLRAH